MSFILAKHRLGLTLLALALPCAGAYAVRVKGGAPPAAPAVVNLPQPDAKAQADDSASLRTALVTAIDGPGSRLQLQGAWVAVLPGQTQLLRGGRAVGIESLRPGETVAFTLLSGSAPRPGLRVVYAQ